MSTEAAPSPPAPGSPRYFVLLYTPAPRRTALRTLLAISDELAAGLERNLDHGVAHLRLQWWEEELLRLQQGSPRLPWLAGWPREQPSAPDLRALVQAAALDLANQRLAARQELQLYATLFVSAAQLLGVPGETLADASAQEFQWLGRSVGTLVAALAGHSWATTQTPSLLQALGERQQQGALLAARWQPEVAPLLVWLALLVRRWQRHGHAQHATPAQAAEGSATMRSLPAPGRFDALAENFSAWRHARRALRRRFRIQIDEPAK